MQFRHSSELDPLPSKSASPAPVSPDMIARAPLIPPRDTPANDDDDDETKKGGERGGVPYETPPLEMDDEPDTSPYCWCCPLWRCLFGGCVSQNPQHPTTRALDFVSHLIFWYAGMHSPGGTFRRDRWDAVTAVNEIAAGVDRKTKVRSRDLDLPGTHCARIPVRIYTPPGAEDPTSKPLPVMIYLHGGGFCIGTRALGQMHFLCNQFASMGFVVVALTYRLAPEFPFPAATEDCYDVLRWVADPLASKAELGHHDRARLVLAGDSAGANLACVLTTLARDGLTADLQPGPRIPIAYQVLIYPVLFLTHPDPQTRAKLVSEFATERKVAFIPGPVRRWFMDSYLPGEVRRVREVSARDRRLAPLLSGCANLPPTTVISAELDVLRHENAAAAEMLSSAGVACKHRHYRNVPHGFVTFSFLKEARAALADLKEDLALVLRGGDEGKFGELLPLPSFPPRTKVRVTNLGVADVETYRQEDEIYRVKFAGWGAIGYVWRGGVVLAVV